MLEILELIYYATPEHNTLVRRKTLEAIELANELQKENETLRQLLKDNL